MVGNGEIGTEFRFLRLLDAAKELLYLCFIDFWVDVAHNDDTLKVGTIPSAIEALHIFRCQCL